MEYSKDEIHRWNIDGVTHVSTLAKDAAKIINSDKINVLDVGSNIGKFTELLSSYINISNAMLIEPVIELHEYAKTKFSNYTHLNMAISDTNGIVVIHTPDSDNLGISRLMHQEVLMDDTMREVECITLSELLLERYPEFLPDLIKIDAEGSDIRILYGLIPYLSVTEKLPIIIYEVDSQTDVVDLEQLYEGLGYRFQSDGVAGQSRDVFMIPDDIQ